MAGNDKHIDWHSAVALGKSGGNSVRNIFGYNNAIPSTFVPAWENATEYTYPTTAETMTLRWNTADAGYTILIKGLDENYDEIQETITLTTTPVTQTTQNQYLRINDLVTVATPGGAFGDPANVISLTNAGNTVTYAKMLAGTGKNQAAIYTVPRGYQFALLRISAFCASASLNNRTLGFRNVARLKTGVILRVAQTEFLEQMIIDRQVPFVYDECTDIEFQLKGSAGTQFIGVFGEGILHEKDRQIHLNNREQGW
ncbi:MAG: hypothetical protein VW551_04450 [Euryarchaeota archaeon]|jgi:hypothetical protein